MRNPPIVLAPGVVGRVGVVILTVGISLNRVTNPD